MSIFDILLKQGIYSGLAVLMLVSKPAISQDGIEELGTLFTNTDQREKLESVRRGTYSKEAEQDSRVSNVRVDGVMIRSDGENVIWVNGESTIDGRQVKGIKVNPKAADIENYSVPVNVEGKQVHIKPGQNWSEGTGQVRDNY